MGLVAGTGSGNHKWPISGSKVVERPGKTHLSPGTKVKTDLANTEESSLLAARKKGCD